MELRGRAGESRTLRALTGALRDGRGAALVLRGDPGTGKTTLLDQAAAGTAPGLRVMRLSGTAAETGYQHAALHRLLVPLLAEAGPDIPPPVQRRALDVACGRTDGPPADPHLVGLAAVALLSRAATETPLLCCVDDAQWIDRESLRTLAFVARRLPGPPFAVLFATRTDRPELGGFRTLHLSGLPLDHGVDLLRDAAPVPLDRVVASRLVAGAGGNPRALLDLARELTPDQLTGARSLPDPLPVGSHLTGHHLSRLRTLPEPTRLWLLLAAARPPGDLAPITAAAHHLELPPDAPAPAEAIGLLTLDGTAEFHPPAARSAVYNGAIGARRRAAHTALAAVTTRADLRAWHLAAATLGPDETTAANLTRAAASATRVTPSATPATPIATRVTPSAAPATPIATHAVPAATFAAASATLRSGISAGRGFATRAALLIRAAELTPDGPARAERFLAAAEAALTAGAPHQALRLIEISQTQLGDDVAPGGSPPLPRAVAPARASVVRAEAHVMTGRFEAYAKGSLICLGAARAVAGSDPRLARDVLLAAVGHVIRAGHLACGTSPAEIAAQITGSDPGDMTTSGLLLEAFAALATPDPAVDAADHLCGSAEPARFALAVPHVRRAVKALLDPDVPDSAVRHPAGAALGALLWDAALQRSLWQRLITVARRTGALWQLTTALHGAATFEIQLGETAAAEELLTEADRVLATIGATDDQWAIHRHPELLAWRGQTPAGPAGADASAAGPAAAGTSAAGLAAAGTLDAGLAAAARLGSGSAQTLIRIGLVTLALGRGDYATAGAEARGIAEADALGLHARILPDLVEAASRSGDRTLAARALAALTDRATATGTPWALGVLARSRALLAPAAVAEPLYREAITQLTGTPARADLARAHLLYGEWLRRRRRRRDARAELRAAVELFGTMGAAGFTARARQELDATGAAIRSAVGPAEVDAVRGAAGSGLTSQEAAIARLAASGATNGEIAAQLFLSANTVDYHLRKVFRKLDVTSRRQLPPTLR